LLIVDTLIPKGFPALQSICNSFVGQTAAGAAIPPMAI
jgi:hypothetical protein